MVSSLSASFVLPLTASLLVAAATTAALAQPTITDIGSGVSPGPFAGSIIALSADGNAVTGQAFNDTGTTAFRWTRSGGLQDIGSLPGGSNGAGTGISANGSVICGAEFSLSAVYRWTSAGGFVDIGSLPGPQGFFVANGISGDGSVIVGGSGGGPFGGASAFRWTSVSGMQRLGTLPGGTGAQAIAISTNGLAITGFSGSATGDRAVRWTDATGIQDLGVLPGGTNSTAVAISGDGATITGSGTTADGVRAFRWNESTGMQALAILPGYTGSRGYGVSGNGSAIVGTCFDANDLSTAFLWTPSLGVVDLNAYLPTLGLDLTGWTIDLVKAISADGSVIAGGGVFNGESRSFVISGIPTPGAATLLGVAALFARRRHR